MHEYGLMEDVVRGVMEEAGARPGHVVTRVRVDVGELVFASHEALEAAFRALSAGTVLDGASLELRDIPGRARCERCKVESSVRDLGVELSEDALPLLCPSCGFPLLPTEGRGIVLQEIEFGAPGARSAPSGREGTTGPPPDLGR